MQTINNVDYDPLDKEIDFSKVKIVKHPYNFDLDEKIKLWLDTLYEDSNVNKKSFYDEVEKNLKEFCNS